MTRMPRMLLAGDWPRSQMMIDQMSHPMMSVTKTSSPSRSQPPNRLPRDDRGNPAKLSAGTGAYPYATGGGGAIDPGGGGGGGGGGVEDGCGASDISAT